MPAWFSNSWVSSTSRISATTPQRRRWIPSSIFFFRTFLFSRDCRCRWPTVSARTRTTLITHTSISISCDRNIRENEPPPPPDPLYLDIEQSYTEAEGLGFLGAVYDQDTDNMAAQTRGFKACDRGAQTLGNYQEIRIRHVHKRVGDYVND